MELGLSGKIAIVCGASQGLGYSAAKELSQEGCTVLICSRDKHRIESAAKKIEQASGKPVYPFVVDLRNTEQIRRFANYAIEQFRTIHILVNNTGGPSSGFFMDFTEADWQGAFQNTLMSAVTLTRHILPVMQQNQWGRIINLQSIVVKQPIDDLILSNSIRMAVVGWAKTLANQYAQYNITINTIATGYTLTERLSNLVNAIAQKENSSAEQVLGRITAKIPARRLANPEEIAALVAFLASERAAYITGTTIPVDGGVVQSML
ncbi:MAG: SDR family oxidoreductase [candidate division KSB1 bacterium]|nr:SDR family oxidoreductase [candidate division KSB1 bacterium]MDZ7336712.1 SDR family oxidoreductase [candidate division KSB1 bacterium]MDZ7358529.1 SDR family oxidoreductase [candidate division KSB1 bacterium]MDZ7376422.1 SDR family oxidoreductase [candidate division KSB1 bacterium]MDZ7402211.1 SDR family oxidoreductase [candidate division KSB1 bacterium]